MKEVRRCLNEKRKDNKMKISIVVPVYNVENYLPYCIESISEQTYSNLEIILVDDGSTDKSLQICNEYAKKDNRIKVLHKENGGNTSARKAGIQIATGEYIGFIDSDDWIEAEMYEKMSEWIEKYNPDVVCTGYYIDNTNSISEMKESIRSGVYSREDNYDKLIYNMMYIENNEKKGISTSLWNKIFRKEIIEKSLMSLNDNIQIYEDAVCVYDTFLMSESIYISEEMFYHYRRRAGSIMQSSDDTYFIKMNLLYLELKKRFEKYPEYSDFLIKQLGKFAVEILAKGINYYFDFGTKVSIPYYLCPFEKLGNATKIVLYGAGKLGKSYYQQIKKDARYQLAAWVDKNYKVCQEQGLEVQAVEALLSMEYDYILLGAQCEGIAQSMKKTLVDLGIEESKIIWGEPRCITNIEE